VWRTGRLYSPGLPTGVLSIGSRNSLDLFFIFKINPLPTATAVSDASRDLLS
jgi:hypothetical protein